MTRGWAPGTSGWASLRLKFAWLRLQWEIARALGVNRHFGVPDRRRQCGPPVDVIDYDALSDDVERRFPVILKHLGGD